MLAALASGTLTRDPTRRRSSQGKDYATALLRVPVEGADALLVSLIAFSDPAVESLLVLKQGDALAVYGRASLRSWEKDGTQHTGLSVVADRVMTAYEAGKRRKASRAELEEER